MGVVFPGNHGSGGNNVTTVTPDCTTTVPSDGAPVAGDIQILCVWCGSLNANTDWTTKPTNTGWTQDVDVLITSGYRVGIWRRVYGGAGGTGNPTIAGPLDQTTSGYNWQVCTVKTTSNRTNTNITLDNSSFVNAAAGNAALPSLFAARAQGSYLLVYGQASGSPLILASGLTNQTSPMKFTLNGNLGNQQQMLTWEEQNAPSNLLTVIGGPSLIAARVGMAYVFSDGGVNNGYSALLAQEDLGQILEPLQPVVMPPKAFLAQEEILVLNNPVIAGGGGSVSSNFGSGVGLIIAT